MASTAAATNVQLEALVDFMREYQELARAGSLLRGVNWRVRSKRLWENLCNSLNAIGSCTKSVEQWQKVWADTKDLAAEAAGAAAAARRSASATGGSPSVAPTLSQIELKILSIMGEGFGYLQTETRVPAFPMGPPIKEPAPISPTHAATHTDPLSRAQPSTSAEALPSPVPQGTPSGVALASPGLPMQNQKTLNARARLRVRRHQAAGSARSLEMEEQRLVIKTRQNEVLNEIKLSIQELCSLVREHVTRRNT